MEDDDSEREEDEEDNANDIRYEDFFEPAKKSLKRTRFSQHDQEREEFPEEELDEEDQEHQEKESEVQEHATPANLLEDEDEEPATQSLSTFEKHQAKMQKMIESLEAEAVAKKDWTMQGEVAAKARPMNSLLEEDLDVDFASKPVPVITEEETTTLEDLIRQRIKDDLWDDVVKKVVVKERAFDPNRKLEMADQKNSKSLAEVYEEEYLRQTQEKDGTHLTEKDEALLKDHEEITTLFNGLCQALDALSNSHFTPKAPVFEVEVLPNVNVPAISMEEVMPSTVSDAKLVSPEEVYQTKVGKSEEEKNASDRKRERADFKRQQKKVNLEKEKARKDVDAAVAQGRKRLSSHTAKDKALKELMGQENVTIISDASNKKSLESKKSKANIIQKGGKVREDRKRDRAENIKL